MLYPIDSRVGRLTIVTRQRFGKCCRSFDVRSGLCAGLSAAGAGDDAAGTRSVGGEAVGVLPKATLRERLRSTSGKAKPVATGFGFAQPSLVDPNREFGITPQPTHQGG